MRHVLLAFVSIDMPGTILRLPYEWSESWKDAEAKAPGDQRSVRSASPQYQTVADRAAAAERFGEAVACEARPAAEVPTR